MTKMTKMASAMLRPRSKPQHSRNQTKPTPHLPDSDEPIVFVQENLRKPGTAVATRFDKYKVAHTIAEARKMGATTHDLACDLQGGVLHRCSKASEVGILMAISAFAPADNAKITFAPNPKKHGSKAWRRYQKYQNAKSLKQAKALGIWPGDIVNDIAKGFVGSHLTSWDKTSAPRIVKSRKVHNSKRKCTKGKGAKYAIFGRRKGMGKCMKKGKGKFIKNNLGKPSEEKLNARKMIKRTVAQIAVAAGVAVTSKVRPIGWSQKHGWSC